MLYGEGGLTIVPYHTLFLYATIGYKVKVKNITSESVQTGFNNGHAVYQQLEMESNVTNEE